MDQEKTETGQRLEGLQILRGFAAVSVMLYHCSHYVQEKFESVARQSWISEIDQRFSWGVQLFFVLSGFVMWRLITTNTTPVRFISGRLIRIYPPYFICVLLMVACKILLIGSSGFQFSHIISMSLLPIGPRSYPIGVEWTLIYEMTFYLLMMFLILIPSKLRFMGLIMWLLIIGVSAITYPSWSSVFVPDAKQVILSSFCLPFIIGCFVGILYSKKTKGSVAPCIFAGTALVVISGFILRTETKQAFLGMGFGFITLSMLWTSISSNNPFIRILTGIGDWSYGIYLSHVPIITIFLALIHSENIGGIFLSVSIFTFCISSLFGIFEYKLHNLLKKKLRVLAKNFGLPYRNHI
jgi:peptidoglycan/LPS O-acetylase OafA/YrhL